ncbi:MAG: class I SAM-dependent methyltransferase [Deltaproteobacteria bacterium]|nr:class I SAM-dependent methyltransferase [Deltaproteobacteria bacterium]
MVKNIYYWFHKKMSRPEERGEYSSGRWQQMVRAEALELCTCDEGNVLEVGCGEGLFLAKLAKEKRDLDIYGADIWKDILDKAKNRFEEDNITNVKLHHCDASSLIFENNFFDVVVCINVFFNLPSEIFYKSLQEISRVCKSGGKIIFDIRNSMNPFLWVKYKLAKYYDETVKDLPLRTYRLKKVTSLLEQHNLEIINKIYIGFPRSAFAAVIIIEARKR